MSQANRDKVEKCRQATNRINGSYDSVRTARTAVRDMLAGTKISSAAVCDTYLPLPTVSNSKAIDHTGLGDLLDEIGRSNDPLLKDAADWLNLTRDIKPIA